MTMFDLWTLVLVTDSSIDAVLPFDCNPGGGEDEGMLVYATLTGVIAARDHQNELYNLDCKYVKLVDYIGYKCGSVSREDTLYC